MRATFDNSYARLPERFFDRQSPVPVATPKLLAVNDTLARALGIDPATLDVETLAGNRLPEGAEPIAQAYAGHQFGNFVPQLGDGRAVLLGEVVTPSGARRDIQLKGAGRTHWSRGGDGRAWLGPVLREYVVSEAMHALGLPTTRALGAVATGETVLRETALPGAVLTRVAASHIRVGTFQYFAARQDGEALQALLDHALGRHYPNAEGPLGLLRGVMQRQADLVAGWLSVGFIHGVMNTDNMSVAGETIDYGPCAFLEAYDPDKVYSSIDRTGRYAYQNQPDIALWNLAQLATALLPLMGENRDAAIEQAEDVLKDFAPLFRGAWLRRFRAKIGLTTAEDGDEAMIAGLLGRMATSRADFTATFRALAGGDASAWLTDGDAWDSWAPDWQARIAREADPAGTMRGANPAFIARNHRVEEMIQAATEGDLAPFRRLNAVLADPFDDQPEHADLAQPARPGEEVRQTFCGT